MSYSPDIRAVIFDMDGVLTDSEPLINAAAIAMFKERGLVVQPADFLPFVGAGEDRYIGGVAEKYGFPLDLPAAKRRTYEIYLDLVPSRLTAFPGARELVAACRQAGLRVAVASSADRVKIAANLEQIGLPIETWNAVVVGEDVVIKKPAPDIFLSAAAKLGLAPAQCVVVEDAVNGIQAAKAAGMRCVAVTQTFPAEKLAQADLVRPTIASVTIADLLGSAPPADKDCASGSDPGGGLMAAPDATPPQWPVASESQPPHGGGSSSSSGPQIAQLVPAVRWWGFWATFGLTVAVMITWMLAQIPVGIVWAAARSMLHQSTSAKDMDNGLLLSLATIVSTPIAMAMVWLFAWLRNRSPFTVYLGFRPVRPLTLLC